MFFKFFLVFFKLFFVPQNIVFFKVLDTIYCFFSTLKITRKNLTIFALYAFVCHVMTVFKYIFSYSKDFDRNFQNNYYFVLFPSIQFLNNFPSTSVDVRCLKRQPTYNNISVLLSQAFFQGFFKFF